MNRYEQSKEVFMKLFGALPDMDKESDHEFMEILRRFIFGDVFHTGDLSLKTRELITITCLATMQTLPQLKAHIAACLKVGASAIEIREAMYQLAPFIGFPRTLNAVSIMNEVFASKDININNEKMGTVVDEERFEKGLAIQYSMYGDEIKTKYQDYPEVPEFLTAFCFGDFYTRKGLDLKTRELLILVVLTTLNLTAQLKVHLLGNLKVGNSKETIYYSLLQCMPYIGFPNVANAMNVLQEINRKDQ